MSASADRSGGRLRRVAAAAAARLPWLVDGYRLALDPRRELALRGELASTRRSAAFLRAADAPGPDGPVALIASYRDHVFETKLDLVLATALRLNGATPVVSIPNRRAHRTRRYARAFGIELVVAQDTISPTADERAECWAAARALLTADLGFDAVRAWRFHEHAIGTHVLSTLIRVTFDGSPDLELETNRALVSTILGDVLANVVRAEHVMRRFEPAVVLVQEANYSRNGPLVDVALRHGADVVHTVATWRDDALISKRLTSETRRVDPRSVAPPTLARVERDTSIAERDAALASVLADRYGGIWELSRRLQPGTTPRSGTELVTELDLDPERRTAVIYAHVLWDGSLFYGDDLFANYTDWLVRTVTAAAGNPRVNWIVKTHPANAHLVARGYATVEGSEVAVLRERFARLPDHVRVLPPDTTISTLSLYEYASYGVTVRGTPGLEIACFGKPAFTAGTGAYSGLGFTVDSRTPDEYLGRLEHIQEHGPLSAEEVHRARWYAYALFVRRPWIPRSFSMSFGPEHPEGQTLELTATSVDEIHRRGDLDNWARWVLEQTDADYAPEPIARPETSGRR